MDLPDDPDADIESRRAWIAAVRSDQSSAWQRLVDRYRGRLHAYVVRRVGDPSSADDIVQEALIGLMVSLPNYDIDQSLEAYLFSICGYKLTDHLRRTGRRPDLSLGGSLAMSAAGPLAASVRGASTIYRSGERRGIESTVLADLLREEIQRWRDEGNWVKLSALEMIFVRGLPNRIVAGHCGLTEQQVANYKSDLTRKLQRKVGDASDS